MRRRPIQRRSRATVEAIEEAAALILEGGDTSRLTTNHIAERAGVSIGSLYEYFSDKDDILRTRGEAEAEMLRNELVVRWSESALGDHPVGLRDILALPFSLFRGRPIFAKAMLLRYARTPWAIDLARRQLEMFLDVIGDRAIVQIFGRDRGQAIALIPVLANYCCSHNCRRSTIPVC